MHHKPTGEPTRLGRATVALVWLIAAAAAILFLLVAAGSAEGGTYRAVQCNPGFDAGRGDFAFSRNSDHYTSQADCEGPGLGVRHDNRTSRRGRWGAWALPAPEGILLTAIRARVAGTSDGGHVPELLAGSPGSGTPIGRAGGAPHTVSWRGAGAEGLEARLRCARASCGEGRRARMLIRRVALRLLDETSPTAELAGPLASGQTQRGVSTFEARTTDIGSGVRRIHLEVNGKPVGSRRVPCELRRRVAVRLRPCPAATTKPYELDTAGRVFNQGLNRVRVCVDDFATTGERNRTCARHKARVDNECPVDDGSEAGTLSARLRGIRRGTIPADRPATVAGTLTDPSGSPIAGARVCVATRTELGSAVEHVVATPRTTPGGHFEARLEPGPNRQVRVAHWPDARHVAERYLRLRVRARPKLRVAPSRALRNGEEARFVVRLHGPEPGGRMVQLEARTGSRWVPIRSHPASRRGVWRDSYRFSSTTGTRRYRFRAVVPRQHGYPYLRGSSPVRRVQVRG